MFRTNRHRIRVCGAIAILTIAIAVPRVALPDSTAGRIFVLDGSAVHDVGEIHLNITNWGLIGSRPGTGQAYSDAPSAEWPAGSGVQYLWASGLWVGAMVDGMPRVSTGQFSSELLADPDDPLDTIWLQQADPAKSHRYPQQNADDDGDGAEDEDPVNGLDDDGDLLVDEDAGGIADQHLRAVMRDDTPLAQEIYPDHVPMGTQVVQESFQWADPQADDFVGFRFTVRNVGSEMLEDVYLGFFADADAPVDPAGGAEDDLPYFVATNRTFPDGITVPVQVAAIYDANGDEGATPGFLGVQILGNPVDAAGGTAPAQVGMTGFRHFRSNHSYASGGDPTNDAERYDALATDGFDEVPPYGAEQFATDYRILASVGPFASLAPGEELLLDVALVIGAGPDELVDHAATAALTQRGQSFDRDGDPATGPDGKEFDVEWLRTPDTPVPVLLGALEGRVDGQVAELVARLNTDRTEVMRLRREATTGVAGRTWVSGALDLRQADAGVELVLRDSDPVGWPRRYALEVEQSGQWRELDAVSIPGPRAADFRIEASPNPFNPRVVISWAQPQEGAVRLRIYDLRGRLVRELESGQRGVGVHEVTWDGTDASSRAAASGVYLAEVVVDGERRSTRLTLVR